MDFLTVVNYGGPHPVLTVVTVKTTILTVVLTVLTVTTTILTVVLTVILTERGMYGGERSPPSLPISFPTLQRRHEDQITPGSHPRGLEGHPDAVMADPGAKRGSDKRSPQEVPASKRLPLSSGMKKTEWARAQFLFLHGGQATVEGDDESAPDAPHYVGEHNGDVAGGWGLGPSRRGSS